MTVDGRPGRVFIVTASARRRGAEIQAMQLAARLTALGWDVDIAALHEGTDGIALDVAVLGRRRLGPSTLSALRRRARPADVVIAYGSATLPACAVALAGTEVPFLYRNISDPAHWLRGPLHRRVTRVQYRRAAGVVALWPGAAEQLTSDLGIDPDRIAVIPNARDPDELCPPSPDERMAARASYGLGDGPVVAFVGAASTEKRLDRAIDVVARLADHTLLVAGDGAGLAAARRLALGELGDRAVFVGEVDDVRPVLHAADVVLITSDVEGMPGVAIEAALCGVPVVSTPVGAVPSLPWVRIAQDVDALARAVLDAGGGGAVDTCTAENYTWDHVAGQWNDLLAPFAGSAGRRSRPA
jgi:glycosyltransferase involved in cell wall biosynthesis